MLKKFLISIFLVTNLIAQVRAEDKSDYPELQVTPRASERLAIEAENEMKNPKMFQLPITVSSSATLIAALLNKSDENKDPNKYARNVGLVVGGGWLAMNAYLAYSYHGYSTALSKVSLLSTKTQREQLIKERLSEEEINYLGRVGRVMKWGSFISNFAAGGYMMARADKNSNSRIYSGVAMVASVLPLLFSNHYDDVATEQQQYKKRIFGTISSNFLMVDPSTQKWVPGVGLTATF